MSKIAIEGMKFYAYHGYYKAERVKGNHFIMDVYVHLDFTKAARKDSIVGTINYTRIYEICKAQMNVNRKLLESVSYATAEEILATFPNAKEVKVRIAKLNPPLHGPTDQFVVEYESRNKK